ncbi:hypothetical protein EYF80_011200 [Liparis tanakae]|uniref:Uncharacterized protein n=1 Tax=Liparis tanakae TaxID=230148 RepID=A0A4Z2IL89_9TELE|nr:hypothetical protein EYF80_011200 [Liparis tanakae]
MMPHLRSWRNLANDMRDVLDWDFGSEWQRSPCIRSSNGRPRRPGPEGTAKEAGDRAKEAGAMR